MPHLITGFFETKEAVEMLKRSLHRYVPKEKISVQGLTQSFPDYANGSTGNLLLTAEVNEEHHQTVKQLFLDYGGNEVVLH